MKRLWVLLLICLWLFSTPKFSFSQTANDSARKSIVTAAIKDTGIYIQFVFSKNVNEVYPLDTSLFGFQNFNPVLQQKNPAVYLGNFGTAHRSLIFNLITHPGFDFGFHQFDFYILKSENIRFYNTTKPFTDLTFALGKKEEQFFKLLHTQNIKPNFNFSVDMQKISSDGLYKQQKTGNIATNISSWYQTPNKRYNVLLNFIYNKITAQENGGIDTDTLFEDAYFNKTLYSQRKTVPVRLDNAENRWREKSAGIVQSLDFGKSEEKKINDSTSFKIVFPKSRIQHSFQYRTASYTYLDEFPPDSGFYPIAYFGYEITLDSSHLYSYSNSLSFQYLGNKSHKEDTVIYSQNVFEAGINYDVFKIYQSPSYDNLFSDTSLENISAKLFFGNNPSKKSKFLYSLKGDYIVWGYNENDFSATANLGYDFSEKFGEIKFHASLQQSNPSWISHHYFGNNFWWNNNFLKTKTTAFGITYLLPKHHLELELTQYSIDNYLYWDSISLPKQASENLQASVFCLKKNFVWRNLHLNNFVAAQFFSNEKYIHNTPFISIQSWFYQNHFFKKVLFAQIGFDIRYSANYYADAYMPVTGQFYLQNRKELKFYPAADFFINMKIRRARLFFKLENLNNLFFGSGYYSIPYYPMPDWNFKAGINWRFYN